jgi:hypothetical protein
MIDKINKKTQSVMVGRPKIEPDLATPEFVRPALLYTHWKEHNIDRL